MRYSITVKSVGAVVATGQLMGVDGGLSPDEVYQVELALNSRPELARLRFHIEEATVNSCSGPPINELEMSHRTAEAQHRQAEIDFMRTFNPDDARGDEFEPQ